MFNIDKDSLLQLNKAMKETIINMDYNNPLEVSAFACSMVSVGNQINIEVMRNITKKEEDSKND